MPIKLTKAGMKAKPATKNYSARYFDTSKLELTGSGGKTGLLSEQRNPKHVSKNVPGNPGNPDIRKKCELVRNIEYNYVPLYILSSRALERVDEFAFDAKNMLHIATSPTGDMDAYVRVSAHGLICDKDKTPTQPGMKHPTNLTLIARMDIIIAPTQMVSGTAQNAMKSNMFDPSKPVASTIMLTIQNGLTAPMWAALYTKNIASYVRRTLKTFESKGWLVDPAKTDSYVDKLSIYDLVCDRSRAWQEDVAIEVMPLVNSLLAKVRAAKGDPNAKISAGDLSYYELNMLSETISHLETYTVALDEYRKLYTQMSAAIESSFMKTLCRENLNIMLSDLVDDLQNAKSQLQPIPIDPSVTVDPNEFNADQMSAITDPESLVMLPSAAGTGKTKTIMGRMDYMVDCGCNPSDILVVTFTNVAADEVRERNRKIMEQRYGKGTDKLVKSMTIDSLVFSIYHENYPDQVLTSSTTLGNALEVYFPNDPDATFMRRTLVAIDDNEAGALTRMNRFVEDNIDHVQEMLAQVGLVTLELANILCYQLLPQLNEPDEIASKHVIMDEVQDTSILQFIFVMRYVQHHKESLFMVGDAAQTLFEFRFANPRAINIMEMSGAFSVHTLTTNYRSRQEILDLANMVLDEIEANQVSKLSLKANDMTPVTEQSFKDTTHLQYCRVQKQADFENNMPNYVRLYLVPYIDECLARGEQVAVLGYTNRLVGAAVNALREAYPDKKIVLLSAAKTFDSTILSSFVKRYWNTVQFMPKASVTAQIVHELQAHITDLAPRTRGNTASAQRARAAIVDHIMKWANTSRAKHQEMAKMCNAGTMTTDEFLDAIKREMFEFESSENSVRQSFEKRRQAELNNNAEAATADIVVSTIHSAKGREWDNAVVLYKDRSPMSQPEQRLYYVGLTRACKTEYVLAYGTSSRSLIDLKYQGHIAELKMAEKKAAKAAAKTGAGPVPDDGDEP